MSERTAKEGIATVRVSRDIPTFKNHNIVPGGGQGRCSCGPRYARTDNNDINKL